MLCGAMKPHHLWKVAAGAVLVALIYYAVKPITTVTFYDPVVISG
jgi:hypothetical protein